jgi:DNA-binding protein|tara:strand:- start:8407 stop:8913 length:507 start_codon:yes stop_codon:yes gene_type:complete
VTLTALGRAVPKAVAVAEIVKRTIGGLHQNTTIDSMTTTKENETPDAMQEATPDTEEETKTQPRRITVISISLSKELGSMNARDAGYQPPDANGIENENAIETEKSRDDAVTRPPPSAHAQRKQTRKEEVKSVGLLTKEESTEVPKARRKTRRGKGGKGKGDAMDIAE